ncbi:MAG: hypothetical protein AAF408_07790 [Pseudomonadota bacterium]
MAGSDDYDIDAMIALTRQRSVSFGFCQGKKPKDSVMVYHRDRKPDAMMRKARQLGETARVVCGAAATKGRVLTLTCQTKATPRLGKQVKSYLKTLGIKMRINIVQPDGEVIEDDEPDDEEPDNDEADSEVEAVDTDSPAESDSNTGMDDAADTGETPLRAQLDQLAEDLHARDPVAAGKLTAALKIADAKLQDGDEIGSARALDWIAKAFDV